MTEPQVWVLIGVFAAAIFGMLGIVTTSFTRTLTTSIGSLREAMDAKFEVMEIKFEVRFENIERRLDNLDRDVQVLMNREFGTDTR